ncbi:hypothetical protein HKX48_007925 [Thoreauomyces humboldtii]|nr:hypothetical protein HKX48_007925 [Thoreauomyces humboldtii]
MTKDFECRTCQKGLRTLQGLRAHEKDKHGWQYACEPCRREFSYETELNQHLTSMRHNPITPDLQCPRCKKPFSAGPSGLLMHLESVGRCAKKLGLTRSTINQFIMAADHDRRLTYSPEVVRIMKEQAQAEIEARPPPVYDDSDVIELPRHVCPSCPPSRGQFTSATALRHHMDSSAHDVPIYHCIDNPPPDTVDGRPRHERSFKTLSALSQHVEYGSCNGGTETFDTVLEVITGELSKMGVGPFRIRQG